MAKRGVYNKFYDPYLWDDLSNYSVKAFEEYILSIRKNKSESTVKQYRNDIRILIILAFQLFGKELIYINRDEILNIRDFLLNKHMSANRINRLMCVGKKFLDYYFQIKLVKGINPFVYITPIPVEQIKDIDYLTDIQIQKLKSALIHRQASQIACLLLLTYDSGASRHEVYKLKKEDLTISNEIYSTAGDTELEYFSGSKEVLKIYFVDRGIDDINSLWIVGRNESKRPAAYETMYDWYKKMGDILTKIEGREIVVTHRSIKNSAARNYENGTHYACKEKAIMRAHLEKGKKG